MLGLGYPGGPVLEKFAKLGDSEKYDLPTPMLGRENKFEFSYSGLKTAMWRLVESEKPLTKLKIENLAATFQNKAFLHAERLIEKAFEKYKVKSFLFGGGVSSNIELRKRLRKIAKKQGISMFVPYSKKLCTDNAGMIGVTAHFKTQKGEFEKNLKRVERVPRLNLA
jgi:N6-L-threonylcarbamoyladenine synthase